VQYTFHIEGGNFANTGFASSEIKKRLKQLNLDAQTIKRIVVALYEAEVNVVAHAYNGDIFVNLTSSSIHILVKDEGPGIPDIEQAMQEGFSTATEEVREMGFGAGMGLPNIKKNADHLDIRSTVGKGTEVEITIYLNHDQKAE